MLVGGTLGALWALGVVSVGAALLNLPIFSLAAVLYTAFLGPGLVLALLIFRIALRRFLNPTLEDGAPPSGGSGAEIDQRVLRNTVEATVLALCLWPAIGFFAAEDGPGLIVALSWSFVVTRLAYWIGYRVSPPLRLFGWSGTFYATLFGLVWAIMVWFV